MKGSKEVIINFCPTGMVPTREMTPHIPIQPSEIIEQTHQAFEVGITIAHLHIRDKSGAPSWEPRLYQEVFEGVRKHCPGLVICGSTSGRNYSEFEKRSAVIELRPDMCSLTLSSLNFQQTASMNPPKIIQELAEKMTRFGVHPELECFDLGMINYGNYLIAKGIITGPFYWNLIMGNIAGLQGTSEHIGIATREIPADHWISLGGLGDFQLQTNAVAIALGYGVRVGLEDNLWLDAGRTKKATNIALVKRIHQLLAIHDKSYLKPETFGNLGFYNKK